MRKLSLLILLVAAAVTAQAAAPFKAHVRPVNRYKIEQGKTLTQKEIAQAKKTPSRIITEQPEGTVVEMERTGRADFVVDGNLHVGEQSGTTRFVFADDGVTVYIRDILYQSGGYFGHSWVQGTIDGDKLIVPLDQSVYYSSSYNADVALCWGTTYVDDEQYFALDRDESVTEVTYTIDREANTYSLEGTVGPTTDDGSVHEGYLGTGLTCYWTDDLSWGGFMDWYTVFAIPEEPIVAPTIITEQPEGELVSFQRAGSCIYYSIFGLGASAQEGKINIVFAPDGNKVYVQNVMWWYDNTGAWLEGTFDPATGMITIPTGQYLNWDPEENYGVQVMWGSTFVYQDIDENGTPSLYMGSELDEEVTEICFKIEGDKISLLDSDGDLTAEFPDNYNATGIYAVWSDDKTWAAAIEFGTHGQIINEVPAVPADPIVGEDAWYDCGDESGYSTFDFTLPTTDVDGNMINPELLSYSIFTDNDQLFTFEHHTYFFDMTEDYTEIPYSMYSNGFDVHRDYVYFYRTNTGDNPLFTRRIGIQVYYTVEEPETRAAVRNESNIVYYELPLTGIESVKAVLDRNAPIYNIMGQQMRAGNLPAGIYIQNGRKFVIK